MTKKIKQLTRRKIKPSENRSIPDGYNVVYTKKELTERRNKGYTLPLNII